jgi:hypothetical protein
MESYAPSMLVEEIPLTDKQQKEGVELLNSLQSVIHGKMYNDHFPEVITSIFRNDMAQADFVAYLRKTVGFEVPMQKKLVLQLLMHCYDTPS